MAVQEASVVPLSSQLGDKQAREQSDQQKPHQPVTAEIGVQEYRLENAAIGQYACERLVADRLRHQYEPGRTRQQRQHQADPSDPRQAPADRGPQLCTSGSPKGGLRDEDIEERYTGSRERCRKVDGAHKNQRVVHALLPLALSGEPRSLAATWKEKLPCVLCVSTESTCQCTL